MAAPEKKDKLRQLEVRRQIQRTLLMKEIVTTVCIVALAGAILVGGWFVYKNYQEGKRREAAQAALMEQMRQQERLKEKEMELERAAQRRAEARAAKEKKEAAEKAERAKQEEKKAAEKAKLDRKLAYKALGSRLHGCRAAHAANLPDLRLGKKVQAETVSHVFLAGGSAAYSVYEVTRYPEQDKKPMRVQLLDPEGAEAEDVSLEDFGKLVSGTSYLLMQDVRVAFMPAGGVRATERRVAVPAEGTPFDPAASEFGLIEEVADKLGLRSPEIAYEISFAAKNARRPDEYVKIGEIPYGRSLKRDDVRKKLRDAMKAENRGKAVSMDDVDDELKTGRLVVKLRK